MSRFLPITMEDYVKSGEAVRVLPNTDSGYRAYGSGRVFAAAPVLELCASRAAGGTGPGINDPLTTTWDDTVRAGSDGTLTNFSGTPWTGTGTVADPYRLTFDSTAPGDYISAPALAFTGAFSIEAWISPTGAGTYHPIFGCYDGAYPSGTDDGYLVYLGGGKLRIEMCDGASHYKDSGAAGLGGDDLRGAGFSQVALVWDGSYIRSYVAGAETGNTAWGYGSGTPIANSLVGNFWGGSTFAGDMACIRAYDLGLTPAQVAQNNVSGPEPLPASSLVFTDIVTVNSSGVTAAGTNVAYSRNASGTYFGPVVVVASAYSAGEQTTLAANWSDPVSLFHYVKVGDYLLPLNGDSVAYQKVA